VYRPANHHPDSSPQRQQRQSPSGMTPAQDTIYQHMSTALPTHTQFISYIIYRPDDEISTSATHKQYLVS